MKHARNIIIDDELWQAVKVEAAKRKQTLQEFVSASIKLNIGDFSQFIVPQRKQVK